MQSRRKLNDHERMVVAYHEAGHALVGELLPTVDPVHKISIVPRGRALGYTLNLPDEDRYLKTRDELIDYMTMLLGGRVAEQIVFGSITTGAADDLNKIAEITRSMVHEYAMGTGLHSSRMSVDGDELADSTRRMRDQEQRDLADQAYRAAFALIEAHRAKLDELAETLLHNEVLERETINEIMDGVRPVKRPVTRDLRLAAASEHLMDPTGSK
jgi:cell division protease FtsH